MRRQSSNVNTNRSARRSPGRRDRAERPVYGTRASTTSPFLDQSWLDSWHQLMLQRVLDKDTPGTRRALATQFTGELTDDINVLRAEQRDLGTRAQMDAIRRTGWAGWARFFILAAWVIVLIDSLIWLFGGAQALNLELGGSTDEDSDPLYRRP